MEIPAGKEVFEGEIASYWMDEGILVAHSKSVKRTVESIRGNVELVQKITGNKRVPLLIYLKNSPVPDAETRKFSTQQLPRIYTAMAMVSKPGLASFIMKILFAFKPPPIPMRNFTDDREATEWLKQYL